MNTSTAFAGPRILILVAHPTCRRTRSNRILLDAARAVRGVTKRAAREARAELEEVLQADAALADPDAMAPIREDRDLRD